MIKNDSVKQQRKSPLLSWKTNWFLVSIFIVIFLAEIHPKFGIKGGPLHPEVTIDYGAVSAIFFISGLSMKTEEISNAVKHYDLHLLVQIFSLFFVPLLVKLVTLFLNQINVDEWIVKGLIVVSCMPPSYSSSVIMTKAVGGNEAAAVFSSVLGSLLGIFATPFTLLFFLRATALVAPMSTIIDLFLTVALPLLFGQMVHHVTELRLPEKILEKSGQIALLLLIYSTFCDMFSSHEDVTLQPTNVVLTIFLVVVIQILLLFLSFWFATRLVGNFSPADVVTILFASTHKSLTLGIPILRFLYAGYNHLFAISFPLLVYYPIQIILGGLLAGELHNWMKQEKLK